MKWLKRRLLRWLFDPDVLGEVDLRLPRLRIGNKTVDIDGKAIALPSLTSDPELASGKIWFRGDINKLRFSPDGTKTVNILKEDDPLNIAQISGTQLTGRDWSNDFAKLQNLDTKLSNINNKLRTPIDSVFVKDVSVGTSATQAASDTQVREEITILADEGNSDTVYVGNSSVQLFPLKPGASLTLRKCSLSKIYLKAKSGTQIIHIIAGGV